MRIGKGGGGNEIDGVHRDIWHLSIRKVARCGLYSAYIDNRYQHRYNTVELMKINTMIIHGEYFRCDAQKMEIPVSSRIEYPYA